MKMLGRKHRPFYRICAIHRSKGRNAPEIEELGTYDPMVAVKSERVKLNLERVEYWLSVGATPSEKVAVLIKKVRGNKFGTAKAPPPMTPPKAPPVPEAPAAEAEGEAAPAAEGSES
jgi:small subunit ribosomal protein S16